jgi:hypothetical protein
LVRWLVASYKLGWMQKTMPDGKDYCERKIKFLKENHQKLVEVGIIVIFMTA